MSYFQRHQRNNEFTEGRTSQVQQIQPYPLRNKKCINPNPKAKADHSFQDPKRSKCREDSHPYQPTQRNSQEVRQSMKMPVRFATQSGCPQSPQGPMKAIFVEADNSMEEVLNSSLNHFQTFIKNQDSLSEQHSQLIEQNQILTSALVELRTILRDKLDKALRKQQTELKGVMSDYLQLISKLLADKEVLTSCVETFQQQLNRAKKHIQSLENQIQEYQSREEKETQIQRELQNKMEDIEKLRLQGHDPSIIQRLKSQNNKIQTLYKCLERSQNQKKILQVALIKLQRADDKYRHLEDEYLAKLTQMQKQHEEEFMEYERAVRETIAKKDETIARLKRLVESRIGVLSQEVKELIYG